MHKNFKVFLFTFQLCIMTAVDSYAQNIAIGSWRAHADLSNVKEIKSFKDKIICRSENGLFYYDLTDESINTLTTIDGLSGTQPTAIYVAENLNLLMVGYSNGSIDFLDQNLDVNSFTGISEAEIIGSKQINHLSSNANDIYIATNFGLVVFDYANFNIKETFDKLSTVGNTLAIKHSLQFNDKLYLSTENGLLIGNNNGSINLKDFRNWNRLNVPSLAAILETIAIDNLIYLSTSEKEVYQLANNELTLIQVFDNSINSLTALEGKLVSCTANEIYQLNGNTFEINTAINDSGSIQDVNILAGQQFIAHSSLGLALINSNTVTSSLIPNGPRGSLNLLKQLSNYTLYLSKDRVGFSYFFNGRWTYVQKDAKGALLPYFNDALIELTTGNAILLSENSGAFSWDTREVSAFTSINDSTIVSWEKLAINPLGELFALIKTQNEYALFEFSTQTKYNLGVSANTKISDYEIVFNGDHYFASSKGLIAYSQTSDSTRALVSSSGNGNLPSNTITDLATSLSGELWIGTSNGISYLSNFNGVFNNENVNVVVPIFEGFFLFQGLNINSISFDGGNRMWVGNRDGLWTFDESVQTNEQRFTKDNSPLNTNNIQQFVINQLNGELFIQTTQQLISYRSASSQANSSFEAVKVFPNPVHLNAADRVSVTGLAYNSEVKITDLAGNLIYEGEANGGTFSWQLTNYNGFSIKPGVYLVFALNNQGEESYRAKFVVIP